MDNKYSGISNNDLLGQINRRYGIKGEQLRLHRDSGGRVYYIACPEGRKVFKLYRPIHTQEAIQSTRVIEYLDGCGFPVVKIVPTPDGELFIALDTPLGWQMGVLFEFAQGQCIGFLHRWRDGKEPPIHPKAGEFGRSVGLMHRLMDGYAGPLEPKGRERYIGDLIRLLRRDRQDEGKIRDLEDYGNALWASVERLPRGFCHGDMHTGNTVVRHGQFTWMDFDRVSASHPVIDVGWLADGTDFNVFDDGALDRSRRLFDALYAGYSRERVLTDGEISAVFGCTAIIHYDLIASIVIANNQQVRKEFVDEQHDWLMRWRKLCAKTL
jgi:Ser/Thr protein kinase RdoA (MazF antagonist)